MCEIALTMAEAHHPSPDMLPSTTEAVGLRHQLSAQQATEGKLKRQQWLTSTLRMVGKVTSQDQDQPKSLLKGATSLLASRSPHELKKVTV